MSKLFDGVDLHELERALVDAICERQGVDRCTLPHCDCATLAAKVVSKIRAQREQAE